MSSTARPPHSSLVLDGRYQLGDELGRGGMGVVYAAEDLKLGRRVAIKVVAHAGGDDSAQLERLFREARAAARAEHPGIVIVYSHGTDADEDVSYIVMERLHGEDLGARIARDAPLSLSFVLRIGIEAADALAALHELGIVHRDVTPRNLYLATRGLRTDEVKLLDLGLARQPDLITLTATDELFGTLDYMAPEQLLDARAVDQRADVYALGLVLHECLTGRRPHPTCSPVQALQRASNGELALPALPAHVPAPLAAVLRRAAAPRPQGRFADAAALRDALAHCRQQLEAE